ncbi:deoxyribose-phosphate aldolase-like [Centruroides sculpturatus]|uniref:deoxyribose-phosphate aldolase-like n=1 Tax=Centruroides sculpturatus TaxID=218467 RepID=UPI000C6E740B|nr:deoxyribose-phosphate aldolase-like [Centruroides sculpturatus]
MGGKNTGIEFDIGLATKPINHLAIKQQAHALSTRRTVKKNYEIAWLLKAVTCIDLTTLNSDDTFSNVQRLCHKAVNPICHNVLKKINMDNRNISVAAVCVYPARVHDAYETFKSLGIEIPIASVATGFPSGQYLLNTRLEEIKSAIDNGASEIDVVINRSYALTGNWKGIYNEIKLMKNACGDAHLKTILATGELGTFSNIYIASMTCMMAGKFLIDLK